MPKKTTPKLKVVRSRPKQRRLIHRFLVVLLGTDPLVWRRIEVPETSSFWDLHVAIQDAMGWQDYHLHQFRVVRPDARGVEIIGIPDPDFPESAITLAGWEVPISSWFDPNRGPVLPARYTYDFGDDWDHVVVHEELEDAEPTTTYPRCIGGARRCPPEDVGGPYRFAEFLKIVANRRHPEHKEMIEWVGGAFDPDDFDPRKVAFDDPQKRWKRAFAEQER
jgi:hypothetical protein